MLVLKVFISRILCSSLIGSIIGSLYNNKIPFYGTVIYTSSEQIKNRIKAMLFWKFYESSEVRFVKKYLTSKYPVIELGSSIGAVTMQLALKISNAKVIAVEANPKLIELLTNNLTRNNIANVTVVNAAYGSQEQECWFEFGSENILGKISHQKLKGDSGIYLKTLSLKSLLLNNSIADYILVCDIEGAEIDILLNEQEALLKCKLLIIETHETLFNGVVYTPNQMKQQLLDMGFELIDQYGVNFVFSRN